MLKKNRNGKIMRKHGRIKNLDNFKLIFSAHGLPEKNIKKGDPYQWQVEQSVHEIVKSLNIKDDKGNFIGDLRSACYSPHFKKVIGIAMINEPYCKASATGLLEIEGNSLAVKVCDLPFI